MQQPPPQQFAQQPQQQAPQYQQNQMPQAAPLGTPPQQNGGNQQQMPQQNGQQQGQHVPLQGGLAQYQNQTAGLYNEVGTRGPRIYFDCDAKYVVEVTRLSTGRSTKPQSNGRPYIGMNFKVVRIDYCSVEPQQTQIQVGTEVSYMKWLPRDPNYPTLEDKYNLVEILNLGAAICGLKRQDEHGNPYLNLALMDQLCQDDGALAKGKYIGIQVTGKKGKAGGPHANTTFYNPDFYPVDANGQRSEGKTPQELQAGG